MPSARISCRIASDGGEGFLEAIAARWPRLSRLTVPTRDALGREFDGEYLWDAEQRIAYIELAVAAGLDQ